jgi:hypothetical protein
MDETTLSLEDMFLLLYCLLDDLYQEHVPPLCDCGLSTGAFSFPTARC